MRFGKVDGRAIRTETILLSYQLASGGDSGATTSATWNTFPLNTELLDTGSLCTLSGNAFTLQSCAYEFFDTQFRAIACGLLNIRVRNITDSSDISGLACTGGYIDTGLGAEVIAKIAGRFTLAATKTLEIQIYTGTGQPTAAWGLPSSVGVEVFGTVGLRRVN